MIPEKVRGRAKQISVAPGDESEGKATRIRRAGLPQPQTGLTPLLSLRW